MEPAVEQYGNRTAAGSYLDLQTVKRTILEVPTQTQSRRSLPAQVSDLAARERSDRRRDR